MPENYFSDPKTYIDILHAFKTHMIIILRLTAVSLFLGSQPESSPTRRICGDFADFGSKDLKIHLSKISAISIVFPGWL